jgi:iron complex transport system substrate-binding protein
LAGFCFSAIPWITGSHFYFGGKGEAIQFRAYQIGAMYNNNARLNEYGGNDYWEGGLANPDVVLADLIKIFHPELLPDHELVYYRKLD